jgi:hypothetical protein
VIAIVAFPDAPGVRFTTNIVGDDALDTAIGDVVQVEFEHIEDVWVPLFRRTGDVDPTDYVGEPAFSAPRPPVTADRFEHRAILSGVGRSAIG